MENEQDGRGLSSSARSGALSRRQVLAGGAAGIGGLLAAGLLPEAAGAAASTGTGFKSVPNRGKPRKVVWANGAIADWNLSYDVGSADAARFLGWSYKKVGMSQSTYSSSQVLQVVNQVIQLHPDVLITPDWVQGQGALLAKAQKAGIYVVVNNADNYPDQLTQLGIPAITSNPAVLGQKTAQVLVEELTARKKRSGTIIIGNPYPQNPNQQGIVVGAESVIKAWNKSHKTSFRPVELADNSGSGVPQAVSLWKAKVSQVGSSLVGSIAIADSSTQAAVKAFQGSRLKAGKIPLAAVDVTTQSLVQLEQGWVLCLIDEGYYMQGWLPIMLAWQALERGFYASGAIDASGSAITRKTLARFKKANALQQKLGKDYGVVLA